MRELGWQVKGIEPNKKAASWARDNLGLDIECCYFDDFECSEKFDVIQMRMVLEHLTSPSKAIERAASMLKKGGELVIIIPDFSGFESSIYKKYHYGLQVPCHLYHFTPKTIKSYLKKYGFKVRYLIHHKFDRDLVASAGYLRNDEKLKWLALILQNKLIRKTILRMFINILSLLGKTSRMTVVGRLND
jgi:predicted SAM-dependent methyltransferase